MQSIIIFEGPDMSGKSTIANALSNRIGIPVLKLDKSKDWDYLIDLKYTTEPIVQILEKTQLSVILDRFYLSEYIYSKISHRHTLNNVLIDIDNRISRLNSFLIVCYKDSYQFDKIDKLDIETHNELTAQFLKSTEFSKCRILFLNTTDHHLKNQLSLIRKFIRL